MSLRERISIHAFGVLASLLRLKFLLASSAFWAIASLCIVVVFYSLANVASARAVYISVVSSFPSTTVYALCLLTAVASWLRVQKLQQIMTRWNTWVSVHPALLLFSITLIYGYMLIAFAHNLGGDCMMAGRFPYSDAFNYFEGAWHVLYTGELDIWSHRRPINALLLASRLGVSGGSLWIATAIQVSFLVVAAYFMIRLIGLDWGLAPGVFAGFFLWRFASEHSWTTMSEALGLTLATCAVAILWIAAKSKREPFAALGIFTYTLACNARSGPQLILPLLVLWMGITFKAEGRWFAVRPLAIGLLSIVAGVAFDAALVSAYGKGTRLGQGNFSLVLYGYARGGPDWGRFYADFPEAASLGELEAHRLCFEKAVESIMAEPGLFIQGLSKGAAFFAADFRGYLSQIFAFEEARVVKLALRLLLLVGFIRGVMILRRDPCLWLAVLIVAGTIISAPLGYVDGWYRILVAGYPGFAVLACVAVVGWMRTTEMPKRDSAVDSESLKVCGILPLVCFSALVFPALLHALQAHRLVPPEQGRLDENVVMSIGPGAPELEILEEGVVSESTRQVSGAAYDAYCRGTQVETIKSGGSPLKGPIFVAQAFNLQQDRPGLLYIVSKSRIVPEKWQVLHLRGKMEQQGSLRVFFSEGF